MVIHLYENSINAQAIYSAVQRQTIVFELSDYILVNTKYFELCNSF